VPGIPVLASAPRSPWHGIDNNTPARVGPEAHGCACACGSGRRGRSLPFQRARSGAGNQGGKSRRVRLGQHPQARQPARPGRTAARRHTRRPIVYCLLLIGSKLSRCARRALRCSPRSSTQRSAKGIARRRTTGSHWTLDLTAHACMGGVPSCKSTPLVGLLVAPPIKRQLPHLLCAKKPYKWLVRRGRQMREVGQRLRNRLYIWDLQMSSKIASVEPSSVPRNDQGVKPLGVACAELAQWGRPWCSYRTLLGCGERKAAPHKKLSLSPRNDQRRA
jgi:hypothetical protein